MLINHYLNTNQACNKIGMDLDTFKSLKEHIRHIKLGKLDFYNIDDINTFINNNKDILSHIYEQGKIRTIFNKECFKNNTINIRKTLKRQADLYNIETSKKDNLSLYSIYKISYYLRYEEVRMNISAVLNSSIDFNRHIIIHLRGLLDNYKSCSDFLVQFFKFSNRLLRNLNQTPHHVWTIENGEEKGLHIHMITKIASGDIYKKWKAGMEAKFKIKLSTPIYKCKQIENISGVLKYIHKGIDFISADKIKQDFDIKINSYYQGAVIGRRSGISS